MPDEGGLVTYRAGCVQDLQHALLTVHLDLLPIRILDGRIIFLHENALDELHSQGRLAHTSRTEHYNLVFPHSCVEWLLWSWDILGELPLKRKRKRSMRVSWGSKRGKDNRHQVYTILVGD